MREYRYLVVLCLACFITVYGPVTAWSALPAGKWTIINHGACGEVEACDFDATARTWMLRLANHIRNDLSDGQTVIHEFSDCNAFTLTNAAVIGNDNYHHVLMFDWHESSFPGLPKASGPDKDIAAGDGYAYAAADAMYALAKRYGFDDKIFAYIGHSRGAIVGSEFVRRLFIDGLPVTQVIYLDGEGGNYHTFWNNFEPYNDLRFTTWQPPAGTSCRFDNIYSKFDESSGDLNCYLNSNYGGHDRPRAYNYNLGQLYEHGDCPELPNMDGIYEYLIDRMTFSGTRYTFPDPATPPTIHTSLDLDNWDAYGEGNYDDADPWSPPGCNPINHSADKKLFNGDFEWGSPAGWYNHGGSFNATDYLRGNGGGRAATLGGYTPDGSRTEAAITHSWFYVKPQATGITFDLRSADLYFASAPNTLTVSMRRNRDSHEEVIYERIVNTTFDYEEDLFAAIPAGFRNEVCTLTFRYVASGVSWSKSIDIDNVEVHIPANADFTPPEIVAVMVGAMPAINGQTVTMERGDYCEIWAISSDNQRVVESRIAIDGVTVTREIFGSSEVTDVNYPWQLANPTLGVHAVSIVSLDAFGNTATMAFNVSIIPRTTSPYPPQITITAPDELTGAVYGSTTICWNADDYDDNAAISIYYDTNNSGANGVLIADGFYEDQPTNCCEWDLRSIPEGTYWIYGVINDGTSSATDYSSAPLTVVRRSRADNLEVQSWEISTEDGDQFGESGEWIDLDVLVRNDYTQALAQVEIKCYSDTPGVIMLDDRAHFNGLLVGEERTAGFRVQSAASFAGNISLRLYAEYETASGVPHYEEPGTFEMEIFVPGSVQQGFTVDAQRLRVFDYGEHGDNDGVMESGERHVRYALYLKNGGPVPAVDISVEAALRSAVGVTLGDRTTRYPDLAANSGSYATAGDDTLDLSIDKEFSGAIPMNLVVEFGNGLTETIEFELTAEPEPWLNMSNPIASFGVIQPGPASIRLSIENRGTEVLVIDSATYGADTTIDLPLSVPPGEARDLLINVDLTTHTGYYSSSVTLHTNDHDSAEVIVPLVGTVIRDLGALSLNILETIANINDGGTLPFKPNNLVAGDLDRDGEAEIAYLGGEVNSVNGAVFAVYKRVAGEWSRVFQEVLPVSVDDTGNLAICDLNRDGYLEVVGATQPNSSLGVTASRLYVLYRNGGTYALQLAASANSVYFDGIAVGNADSQASNEVAVFVSDRAFHSEAIARVDVYRNSSGYTLSQVWSSGNIDHIEAHLGLVGRASGVNIADSDGDGVGEVLFMADGGQMFVYEGLAAQPMMHFEWGNDATYNDRWECDEASEMIVRDIDGDGRNELAFVSEDSDRLYVLESSANNTYDFGNMFIAEGYMDVYDIDMADLNVDGNAEIILGGDSAAAYNGVAILSCFADNSYAEVFRGDGRFIKDVRSIAVANLDAEQDESRELAFGYSSYTIPILGVGAAAVDLICTDELVAVGETRIEGLPVEMVAHVLHAGVNPIPNVSVQVVLNGPGTPAVPIVALENVAPGDIEVRVGVDGLTQGMYTVCFVCDSGGVVIEDDEANNTGCAGFEVSDDDTNGPVVQAVAVPVGGDGDGLIDDDEQWSVSAVIADPSGVVAAWLQIDGGPEFAPEVVEGEYHWTLMPLAAGQHLVCVRAIDADNSPSESTNCWSVWVYHDNAPPYRLATLGQRAVEEDGVLGGLDLATVFADPDGDALYFAVESPPNVAVTISALGVATVKPAPDWNGSAIIVFTAEDEQMHAASVAIGSTEHGSVEEKRGRIRDLMKSARATSDTLQLEVVAVNDAPRVASVAVSDLPRGENGVFYDFELLLLPYLEDVDDDVVELAVSVFGDPVTRGEVVPQYNSAGGLLTLHFGHGFSLPVTLAMRVTDPDGAATYGDLALTSYVATYIRRFSLLPGPGEVAIRCEIGSQGALAPMRVAAHVAGGVSWFVPLEACGPSALCAYDSAPYLRAGGTVRYVLEEEVAAGQWIALAEDEVAVPPARLVSRLLAIAPNPFNPKTTIEYEVGVPGVVRIDVYDVAGRKIVTLVNSMHQVGLFTADWLGTGETGQRVASGVYMAKMSHGSSSCALMMTLAK